MVKHLFLRIFKNHNAFTNRAKDPINFPFTVMLTCVDISLNLGLPKEGDISVVVDPDTPYLPFQYGKEKATE